MTDDSSDEQLARQRADLKPSAEPSQTLKSPRDSGSRILRADPDRTVTATPELVREVVRAPSAQAAQRPSAPPPELVLPPRYRDLGPLASGGFGEVRRVFDQHLERVVAMKLLHAHLARANQLQRRFRDEARLTAELEHPGIVPLHDWGQLDDGRLWFTMREVRGRTLRKLIDELHAGGAPGPLRETASGWTFRRLIDAFARCCQAVAFAHRRGIVHRDLKPENIMIGELGEVLVMDWGLARRVAAPLDDEAPPSSEAPALTEEGLTQLGDVIGTPAFMPPEQASGEKHLHGLPSDVYALGAILYHLLSGRKPYEGDKLSVLLQVRLGPPLPIAEAAAGKNVPAELLGVCERAMRRAIDERYPDAEHLAREVLAWLDGVRRREQALEALAQVGGVREESLRLRAEAARAQAEARELLASVRRSDPVSRKQPGWAREDAAAQSSRRAALLETSWLEKVHGALSLDPELPEAHAALAEHYREQLVEAELSHQDEDAARLELLLRTHDRGQHAAFLRGDGVLSLVTQPPGAIVSVEPYLLHDRRLVPGPSQLLGPSPLRAAPLARGSYRVRVRAPGHHEVIYPILVERDGRWDGVRPGSSAPHPIALPRLGELGDDEVYVPAGWCWIGGDTLAMDSLPRQRVWVDAFVLERFPVTNAQFLEFLNALVAQGRHEEAALHCPIDGPSSRDHQGLAYQRDADGRYRLADGEPGLRWLPDWPVVFVDWHGARAYARWRAEHSGLPYRLPNEIEREKAARGVDGRLFPWGNHFEAAWACCIDSHEAPPTPARVRDFPLDESPYGARGLAGNVREWCDNLWTREGPVLVDGLLHLSPTDPLSTDFRAVRGGAWKSVAELSRAAGRFASRPEQRWTTTGLRLARSFSAG